MYGKGEDLPQPFAETPQDQDQDQDQFQEPAGAERTEGNDKNVKQDGDVEDNNVKMES